MQHCCENRHFTSIFQVDTCLHRILAAAVLLPAFVLMQADLFAQVVNTERLRQQASEGWDGEFDVAAGFNKNKAGETFRLNARGRVDYSRGAGLWMLFGAAHLARFREVEKPGKPTTEQVNDHFLHLRYNWRSGQLLTWEVFSQYQSNRIQATRLRILSGAGPRFRLLQTDSAALFLGALAMYEYEETSEEPLGLYHRDLRLSTYVSGSWQVREFLNLSLVMYYQPRIDLWKDYRLSGEASVNVQISKRWRFTSYFQLIYDAAPPAGVSPTIIRLNQGVGINF
jgi:hypothetical protein